MTYFDGEREHSERLDEPIQPHPVSLGVLEGPGELYEQTAEAACFLKGFDVFPKNDQVLLGDPFTLVGKSPPKLEGQSAFGIDIGSLGSVLRHGRRRRPVEGVVDLNGIHELE